MNKEKLMDQLKSIRSYMSGSSQPKRRTVVCQSNEILNFTETNQT